MTKENQKNEMKNQKMTEIEERGKQELEALRAELEAMPDGMTQMRLRALKKLLR